LISKLSPDDAYVNDTNHKNELGEFPTTSKNVQCALLPSNLEPWGWLPDCQARSRYLCMIAHPPAVLTLDNVNLQRYPLSTATFVSMLLQEEEKEKTNIS